MTTQNDRVGNQQPGQDGVPVSDPDATAKEHNATRQAVRDMKFTDTPYHDKASEKYDGENYDSGDADEEHNKRQREKLGHGDKPGPSPKVSGPQGGA